MGSCFAQLGQRFTSTMPQVLRLEYACTEAEKSQAQNLSVRQKLGGGSKLRTWLVLLLLLNGLLLNAWFRFPNLAQAYRALLIVALFVGAYVFVVCKRIWRETASVPITQEISEAGVASFGAAATVRLPWSAFSQCLESNELFVLMDRTKTTLIVVPKRVFPSEDSQTWFREQSMHIKDAAPTLRDSTGLPVSASTDVIRLTVQLGLRDYFDRTLASWRTWGFCLFIAGLELGAFFYAAVNSPPNPVNSNTKVFLLFGLPFFLASMVMIIVMFSVYGWRINAKHFDPEQIALSDSTVEFAGRAGSGNLPWSHFAHYKETFGSFIIWRGSLWMIFPKRAFASQDDVSRCREFLDRNLRRSAWFFG